jgi:hypothetical protein
MLRFGSSPFLPLFLKREFRLKNKSEKSLLFGGQKPRQLVMGIQPARAGN